MSQVNVQLFIKHEEVVIAMVHKNLLHNYYSTGKEYKFHECVFIPIVEEIYLNHPKCLDALLPIICQILFPLINIDPDTVSFMCIYASSYTMHYYILMVIIDDVLWYNA